MAQQPTVPPAFTTGMQNSTQGAVPASTPPPRGVAKDVDVATEYKYYFYCSPPTLNSIVNYSKRVAFRNHFYRTNDEDEAQYIRDELMNRGDTLAYLVEEIGKEEFLKRTSIAPEPLPTHPGEGVIEPLPGAPKVEQKPLEPLTKPK